MSDEAAVAKLMAEFGRRGGKSRLTTMTAEQRRESARRAARARWARKQPTNPTPTQPTDPLGSPDRDQQYAEAGIMSTSGCPKPAVPAASTKNPPRGLRAAA